MLNLLNPFGLSVPEILVAIFWTLIILIVIECLWFLYQENKKHRIKQEDELQKKWKRSRKEAEKKFMEAIACNRTEIQRHEDKVKNFDTSLEKKLLCISYLDLCEFHYTQEKNPYHKNPFEELKIKYGLSDAINLKFNFLDWIYYNNGGKQCKGIIVDYYYARTSTIPQELRFDHCGYVVVPIMKFYLSVTGNENRLENIIQNLTYDKKETVLIKEDQVLFVFTGNYRKGKPILKSVNI